ncbi:MAG: gamma-glutamyl-gamma-aminobutyrate hydrolase family protein, partial [Rhodospirillaceae bacterium]
MPPRIAIAPCRKMPDYVASVTLAGGRPWELSHDADSVESVLASCDGLLLTGGADVAPERYGEARHPTVTGVDAARDEYEIALVRAALAADLPILAICRGLQVMNVAAGGSLVQDIPSQVGTTVPHQVPSPKAAIAHDVGVVAGSRLAELVADGIVGGRLPVNSRHHQAVQRIAAGFVVTAEAPDGVIEALERPESRFCVGVQWHPENFVESRTFLPLF